VGNFNFKDIIMKKAIKKPAKGKVKKNTGTAKSPINPKAMPKGKSNIVGAKKVLDKRAKVSKKKAAQKAPGKSLVVRKTGTAKSPINPKAMPKGKSNIVGAKKKALTLPKTGTAKSPINPKAMPKGKSNIVGAKPKALTLPKTGAEMRATAPYKRVAGGAGSGKFKAIKTAAKALLPAAIGVQLQVLRVLLSLLIRNVRK
jgi:hypothetical protein